MQMNLSIFLDKNLFNAGTSFFKQLNIPLNSNTTTPLHLKDILKDKLKSQEIFDKDTETYFLGLVDRSVFDGNLSLFDDGNVTFDQAVEKIHDKYDGMMIFAVRIDGIASPTRTQLADLTRAFNRASKSLPVVVLFQYGNFLTLATSKRTKYKQPWREGEKIGKISLLKDIDILNPHTGHIKILDNLALKPGVRDFNGLSQQWREVFDVQLLNRNFYKELSAWYFWALRQVEFPDDAEKNKEIRNSTSVIRLITRLIFVWFLKEKRLVPEILFNKKGLDAYLKYDDINNSTYYKAILQNLFFATLNTKMKKDDPESRKFVNRQYGVQVFYRYERFFQDKEKALKLFEAIPFLNGGLFENLDKNIGKDNEMRIDCFSNRPVHEKKLKVPDCLFLGDEVVIDLSREFGSNKRKKEKVRGIIHILNSYKFTIDENTPVEEEIALDPELLGKVFENLLASYNPETKTTARKQTGSFYTPREIVDYMVDESLKASLSNLVSKKIDNATEDDIKTGLDILFEYTEKEHAFTDNEVSKIVEAISELKILDPACGSGAFPMGILHKLVFILNKIDGDNKKWRDLQKQRAVKETEKAYSVGDKEERHQRLEEIEEAFDFNTSDYGRKLFLIENSIYGVDIQPIAVQIAKLRFFISLIVDQNIDEDKENLGILPLPNLETKFVAANTLIGIDKKGQLELNFQNPEIDKKEKELAKVRERHFSARTPDTKEKRRVEDESLRNEIAALLEKDGFASDVTKKLAHWNPYDQNASAGFFDMEWMFGLKDGFDIVIGNPPYIKEYTFRNAFDGLRQSLYYQGKMDLWYLFACHNLDLLKKEKGVLTFIATNNWVTNYGASKMRNKIIKDAKIMKLLDFGNYMIFEHSDIQTMIMIFRNDSRSESYHFDYRRLNGTNRTFNDVLDLIGLRKNPHAEYLIPVVIKTDFINRALTFISSKLENIVMKIEQEGTDKLKEKEVAQGIVCPQDYVNRASQKKLAYRPDIGDGIFVLSNKEEQGLNLTKKELELIKPYYTTKELFKYYGNSKNNQWIIYTNSAFKDSERIKPYPNIKKHLDKFQAVITSVNKPYGLHRSRDENFFKGEKIIAVRKCIEPTFTYTDFDCYVSATFYVIKYERLNMKFLTALLNSLPIKFWLRNKGKMQGNNFQIDKEPLLNIPIKKVDNQMQRPFTKLLDQILRAKKSNYASDTTALEAEIDGRVAHLYNLTEEEYSLILKETNCPDPFRVAALNIYRDIAKEKIKD